MIPCVNSELSLIQINRDDCNVTENNLFSLNNNEASRRAFASAVNLIRPEYIFVKHFFDNQNQVKYISREFFNFNHDDRIVRGNRHLSLESSSKSYQMDPAVKTFMKSFFKDTLSKYNPLDPAVEKFMKSFFKDFLSNYSPSYLCESERVHVVLPSPNTPSHFSCLPLPSPIIDLKGLPDSFIKKYTPLSWASILMTNLLKWRNVDSLDAKLSCIHAIANKILFACKVVITEISQPLIVLCGSIESVAYSVLFIVSYALGKKECQDYYSKLMGSSTFTAVLWAPSVFCYYNLLCAQPVTTENLVRNDFTLIKKRLLAKFSN